MRNTVRTFVAVEIPREVQQRALQLVDRLRVADANVKWVGAEQLHWSLKFLGEVDLVDVAEVCQRVAHAVEPLAPFDVDAHGAGAFPNPHHPRTIWLGMSEGTEAMIELHEAIETQLAGMGFRREQRRFRPHLTIGRVRHSDQGLPQLAQLLQENAHFDGGLSTVFEVVVFSSTLGPKGPTYEPLGHAELGGR